MRGGIVLIVIALLLGYLGVTGKYKCFTIFFACISGSGDCGCGSGEGYGGASGGSPIIVTPGGANPNPATTGVYGAQGVFDATQLASYLPPLESFT